MSEDGKLRWRIRITGVSRFYRWDVRRAIHSLGWTHGFSVPEYKEVYGRLHVDIYATVLGLGGKDWEKFQKDLQDKEGSHGTFSFSG